MTSIRGKLGTLTLVACIAAGCGRSNKTGGFGEETGGKGASGKGGSAGKGGSGGGKGGEGGDGGDSGGMGGEVGGGGAGGIPAFTPDTPKIPFGSHGFKYPDGVLKPSLPQAMLDDLVKAYYNKWSEKYLVEKCGGYVVQTEGGTGAADGTFTVSEGHGYGMIIAAMMAGHDEKAQQKFNGLYWVFRRFPSTNTPDLMDWQILNKCPAGATCKQPTPGCFRIDGPESGSATDGDMDIAFALLLADKQWGSAGSINYLAEAKKVITAVKNKEMNPKTKFPLLADDIAMGDPMFFTTRPSDFMVDHFRAFGKASGDAFWMQSVDGIYGLLGSLQMKFAPMTGLVPDFVVKTDTMPEPAPPKWPEDEGLTTAEYAYNSCRVPWRIATDYIATGEPRAKAVLQKLNAWVKTNTTGVPGNIMDGYKLDGSKGSDVSGYDLSFGAPFAVAAITDSDQMWVDATWASVNRAILELYFGDSIKMISMIVITGNWWAPN
jgi:endo-1,4-beta-D-glucanase Y